MVGSSLEVEIYIYVGDDSLKNLAKYRNKKILMVARFIFLKSIDEKVANSLYETSVSKENIKVLIKTAFLKCIRCVVF